MSIAMVEALRLAQTNRALHEEIEDRQAALEARVETEFAAQEQGRRECYDEALVPFRDVFIKLKNVDLAELEALTAPSGVELPRAEMQAVRLSALGMVGALAGGVASGVGAGAGAFTAVGAFAAASTGTPIAALSGVAATNATLAFLGGGTLVAGGGGVAAGRMVLGGLVAAPILVVGIGYFAWRGHAALRTQRATALALREAEMGLTRTEDQSAAVLARSRQVRALLGDLRKETVKRLPDLAKLVDHDSDYAAYTPVQRALVATAVGLVSSAVTVVSTPLTDDAGAVTYLSGQVLADVRQRLDDLSADDEVAA